MSKKVLFVVVLLVLASFACGRQLAEWERTPGAITPPVDDLTLYACVTAEADRWVTNTQSYITKGN
jgi:hypothetical protein